MYGCFKLRQGGLLVTQDNGRNSKNVWKLNLGVMSFDLIKL